MIKGLRMDRSSDFNTNPIMDKDQSLMYTLNTDQKNYTSFLSAVKSFPISFSLNGTQAKLYLEGASPTT